jgi:hypothetical protein
LATLDPPLAFYLSQAKEVYTKGKRHGERHRKRDTRRRDIGGDMEEKRRRRR